MQIDRKSKNDNIPIEVGCDSEQGLTTTGIMPSEQLPHDKKKDIYGNLGMICNFMKLLSFSRVGKGNGL